MKPTVTCVMLVNGREAMVRRAVDSFRSQTYQRKQLYIYDTSQDKRPIIGGLPDGYGGFGILYHGGHGEGRTIGALRNWANHFAAYDGVDLIAHWDSDDWSAPERLEEQVERLERLRPAGIECVGYREMLFWDTRPHCLAERTLENTATWNTLRDEAWIFTSRDRRYLLGSSMLYTVDAWHRYHFSELPGCCEDQDWWSHNNSRTDGVSIFDRNPHEPMMICAIHGGNTSPAYERHRMRPPDWTRDPSRDQYAARKMAL